MGGKRMPIQLEHIYNNTEYKNDIGYGNAFKLPSRNKKVTIGSRDYYQYMGTEQDIIFLKKKKNQEMFEKNMILGIIDFGI